MPGLIHYLVKTFDCSNVFEEQLKKAVKKGITKGHFFFYNKDYRKGYDNLMDLQADVKERFAKDESSGVIIHEGRGNDFGFAVMKLSDKISPVVSRNDKGEKIAYALAPYSSFEIHLMKEAVQILLDSKGALDFVMKFDEYAQVL